MDEQKYCNICGVGDYCGHVFLPCACKLCEGCKGVGVKFEKCPSCDTKNPKMYHEHEISKPGEWNDGELVINNIKRKIENLESTEVEILKSRSEIDANFEKQMSELKRKREKQIRDVDKKLEMCRYQHHMHISKNELLQNLKMTGRIPSNNIVNYKFEFSTLPFGDSYEPKFMIGKWGIDNKKNGYFDCPHAVSVNSKGQILVCDTHNNRIQIFNQVGSFVKSFGTRGHLPGQFTHPVGIAIDNKDNIYVSDEYNHRIQIFNDDGSKLIKIIGKDDCRYGNKNGEFYNPEGIFINPQNQDILVADTFNHRIQIFDKDCNFIRKFGLPGEETREMQRTFGVTMNSQNEIMTSEFDNNRIQVFDYEGNHLRFVGNQNGELKQPCQLCVDDLDNVYVGTWRSGFPMQIFDKDGKLINSFKSKTEGCLFGVNINSIDGSLVVSDSKNNVVYIY